MAPILLFLVVVATLAGWWLTKQGLLTKPWLEQGAIGSDRLEDSVPWSTSKTALLVFMGVVSSLFALLVSAYAIRMQSSDWRALPVPTLLWVNTGQLILASLVLEWTRYAARRREWEGVKLALTAGCLAAASFLVGQVLVWRQLTAAGYFLAANPPSFRCC